MRHEVGGIPENSTERYHCGSYAEFSLY